MEGLPFILGIAFLATSFTEWKKKRWHRGLAAVLFGIGVFLLWFAISSLAAH